MTKASLLSLEQTDAAGLFTIIFENENHSEFVKFVNKFKDDAIRKNELRIILNQIDVMLQKGIEERRFRPEGKMSDGVAALPVYQSGLRLYCLRLSDNTRYKMKQDKKGRELFRQIVDETPEDLKKQLSYSDAIAIKLDGMLKQRGMSQRDLAKNTGKTEAEVSRWLGGTHNFTLRTLSKISIVLGEDVIVV